MGFAKGSVMVSAGRMLKMNLAALVLCTVVIAAWTPKASALGIADAIYFGGTAYFELADVQGRGLDFIPLESSMQNAFGSFSLGLSNFSSIGALDASTYGQENWTFTNTSGTALYDVQLLITWVYIDEGVKGDFGDVGIAGADLYIAPIAGKYVAAFDLGDIASGATSNPLTIQYHAPNGFGTDAQSEFLRPIVGIGLYANAIPEPSAALLFALGGLSVTIFRRR